MWETLRVEHSMGMVNSSGLRVLAMVRYCTKAYGRTGLLMEARELIITIRIRICCMHSSGRINLMDKLIKSKLIKGRALCIKDS
jgi:hypothetical protein